MTTSTFKALGLNQAILRALSEAAYQAPTPIQQAAIPRILAGEDVLATAQTGTGKTAAFALPLLHLLDLQQEAPSCQAIRALVLAPTRELALQIDAAFQRYGRYLPYRTAVVVGGVALAPQINALYQHPAILTATPGRLVDLLERGHLQLGGITYFVMDEADRLLDLGFAEALERIVAALPDERQTLFFSATLSDQTERLGASLLRHPVQVAAAPPATVPTALAQRVLFVEGGQKPALLCALLQASTVRRALVFTRTKYRAERLAQQLVDAGMPAALLHSDKDQVARQEALAAFEQGATKFLVATDLAARGLDPTGVSHVINYELPAEPQTYVHRVGRTARAGAIGAALSFCAADELPLLKKIEALLGVPLVMAADHPYHAHRIALAYQTAASLGSRPRQRKRTRPDPRHRK
jgi:ATP-dependent RNA helicase RhlE